MSALKINGSEVEMYRSESVLVIKISSHISFYNHSTSNSLLKTRLINYKLTINVAFFFLIQFAARAVAANNISVITVTCKRQCDQATQIKSAKG